MSKEVDRLLKEKFNRILSDFKNMGNMYERNLIMNMTNNIMDTITFLNEARLRK